MEVLGIPKDGELPEHLKHDEMLDKVIRATLKLYQRVGYVPPWISYLAVKDSEPVGTCAFKSPPDANRVEIAYFTFPGHTGQGIATWMAKQLVGLANERDPQLVVFAQTLPEENASTHILAKLGFERTVSVDHPEDGKVWQWELR